MIRHDAATMTTFNITSAYVGSKPSGTVQAPNIGEWWPLTVEFTVAGTPKNNYHIDFAIAEQSAYVELLRKRFTSLSINRNSRVSLNATDHF